MKMLRIGMMAMASVMLADAGAAQCEGVDTLKPPGKSVVITWAQNGRTIHLHAGDEAVVTLAAAPGLGSYWQLEPLNSPVAVLADTEEVAVPPASPGGAVNHLFHMQMKSAGTVTLRFQMRSVRMPAAPPMQTFTVTLQAQ